MHTGNLLGQIPSPLPNEVFTDLVSTNHFRIERILSQGQQTPTGEWFDQDEHEWVLLVQGEAILVFITPDSTVLDGRPGAVYMVRAKVNGDTVGRGPMTGQLKLGMAGQVELVTGEDSVLELVFKKIQSRIRLK